MLPTVQNALNKARRQLLAVSDAPDLDAERLLLHVFGQHEPAWLYARSRQELSRAQQTDFERFVRERRTGKPLAYILGEAEFYGRPFYVSEDVLIPRPETEMVVDAALYYLDRRLLHRPLVHSFSAAPAAASAIRPRAHGRGKVSAVLPLGYARGPSQNGLKTRSQGTLERRQFIPDKESFTIADIGTGSGCIAVTLALEILTHYPLLTCPVAKLYGVTHYSFIATDISEAALAVARRNAKRHGVEDMIEFVQGDMLNPLRGRHIDLIVSNPPYIPTAELKEVATSPTSNTRGLSFEPTQALDGGEDGQEFIKVLQASGIPCFLETTGGRIVGDVPHFA